MTEVKLVNAEAVTVGPDERLVVLVKDPDAFGPDEPFDQMSDLLEAFRSIGLGPDRVIVLMGGDVELAKVTP